MRIKKKTKNGKYEQKWNWDLCKITYSQKYIKLNKLYIYLIKRTGRHFVE